MRHIHKVVFHVSLRGSYKSTFTQSPSAPPPLYTKDDQEYFDNENIRDSPHVENWLQYVVKWKGYLDLENSWEPPANIPARSLITESTVEIP